jgi:hypothetical protein
VNTSMNIYKLNSDSEKLAKALIKIATKSPQPLKIQWKQVKHWTQSLHGDGTCVSDKKPSVSDKNPSDCHYDGHHDKSAAKKGIIFPPYPFED